MTPTQRKVAGLWAEILRTNRISLHDNFFDVGGHSMLVVKLHAALKREFDSDLTLTELFQHTTVAAQAARLSLTTDGRCRVASSRGAGEEATSWLTRRLLTQSRSSVLPAAFPEPKTSTGSGAISPKGSNAWMCRPKRISTRPA